MPNAEVEQATLLRDGDSWASIGCMQMRETMIADDEQARLIDGIAGLIGEESSAIDVDADLRDTGRMDSLMMVSLVDLMESDFGVKPAVGDIVPANFCSVRRIMALIATLRARA